MPSRLARTPKTASCTSRIRSTGQSVIALLDRVTRRAGRTLVLVTHSPQVAELADRVLTIEDGRVVPLERSPA